VAIRTQGQDFGADRHLRRAHNEHLLAMLDDLCRQAELAPNEIDVIGFGCGPGSFTGVRIAAAATQAIAFAAQAQVVPVPTSRVWVAAGMVATQQTTQTSAQEWLCAVRSRGTAFYLSRYTSQANEVDCLHSDVLLDEWSETYAVSGANAALVGDIAPWMPESIQSLWVEAAPSAAGLLGHVEATHQAGASLKPELALPAYVSGDSPWRPSRPEA